MVNSTRIEFIVKKPKDPKVKVLKWNDKSKRIDVGYADTDKIIKEITEEAVAGEIIAAKDLLVENGQNLLQSMQYEVANDLADYLANNNTNVIAKYAIKFMIEKSTEPKSQAIKYVEAMLGAWNTLFQYRNIANCRFFITNALYDSIVYLADNKGLITDNEIAQQLRLNGNYLYIKRNYSYST
ncbi:hypothetical protein [Spiroplasma endosymbiont of Apeira syringaria]|uniref:hypothetical protein n=1 Tax=Spiroplasma endosymbiont of Apeira syringaria TaxID=3066307 RepID=UPI0030CFEB33